MACFFFLRTSHGFSLLKAAAVSRSTRQPQKNVIISLFATSSINSRSGEELKSSSSSAAQQQQQQQQQQQPPVIILKRSRQSKAFRNGNQLVFERAIKSGTAPTCALVQVAVDSNNNNNNDKKNNSNKNKNKDKKQPLSPPLPIGWGVYNPNSLYKIRILCHRYLQSSLWKRINNIISASASASGNNNAVVAAAAAAAAAASGTGSQQQRHDLLVVEELVLYEILKHHFQMARNKRIALNLPKPGVTTMYRFVNGEGDGLSGLQIDIIDKYIVVQSSASWCEKYKTTIVEALYEVINNNNNNNINIMGEQQEVTTVFEKENIIWKVAKSRLKQDGYYDENNYSDSESDSDESDADESDAEPVLALENGVIFRTFPALEGQKTGVYCDQRENRKLLSQYTNGKSVLDLCCFHGGFTLTAVLRGNATRAVGIDSSAAAIEAAKANAMVNNNNDDDDDHYSSPEEDNNNNNNNNKITFLRSDISDYMQQAWKDQIFYDVVVLDPPKLAPTVSSLERARRKYHGLNRDAIKLVNPTTGGILMTCTCSAAMTQQDGGQYFLSMVSGAAQAAQREVTLLSKSGAASCHTQSPVSWPAGAYLTAALFYVHPSS